MSALFAPEYWLLWAILLAAALFWPVRNLIWVLYVRRTEAASQRRTDDGERARLKQRATWTALLLCFVFSVLYGSYMFRDAS